MTDTTDQEKVIRTTRSTPGYAHTRIEGTYEGPVTRDDLFDRFDRGLGGAVERMSNGKFTFKRYDD